MTPTSFSIYRENYEPVLSFSIGVADACLDRSAHAAADAVVNNRSEQRSAVKAFKTGVALLLVSAIFTALSLAITAPYLFDISACLTVLGALVAAAASERYRRAG